MISTVTTTTVTTIVTLTTTGISLGVIAIILLIALLGAQEVATADTRLSLKALGKYLNVSVLPLLSVFTLIILLKVLEIA